MARSRSKSQRVLPNAKKPPAATNRARPVVGWIALLVAAAFSLLLVVEHLAGLALPGCGEGSGCSKAAASVWGKVPGVDWPVSFLGLAYFLAMLAAWGASRGLLPRPLRWVVRLGAAASLVFSLVILFNWDRYFCPYCLATHAANFVFWITVETTRGAGVRFRPAAAGFAGIFVVATVALGGFEYARRADLARQGEAELAGSVQDIIARSQTKPGDASQTKPDETRPALPVTTTAATTETQSVVPTPPTQSPDGGTAAGPGFTGRYRLGPEQAAIRLVLFTDFQCPDCRQIEQQVTQIVARHPSVSVSMKHFPFSTLCNPHIRTNLHPNACWAARAAEAAGILWGNDGFWKMHDWLFERAGRFEKPEELVAAIRSFGYEPGNFFQVMQSEEPNKRIQADIQEAVDLGIYFTPMIFINGVELKGWNQPNALIRAVDQIVATNPPPRTAAADHPPRAFEKYIADWRDQAAMTLPADEPAWTLGPAEARVRVVLWGDFQEAGTAQADGIIRRFVQSRGDVNYTYRHSPYNSECNPKLPFPRHPLACWAASLAEAGGRLDGNDGYWRLHAWLMDNADAPWRAAAGQFGVTAEALRQAFGVMNAAERDQKLAALKLQAPAVQEALRAQAEAALHEAAPGLGFEAAALEEARGRADVAAAIRADIDAGAKLPVLRHGMPAGLHSIPTIFINDKLVPRWLLDDRPVLEDILKAAVEDVGRE